jgi:hypothetical protein
MTTKTISPITSAAPNRNCRIAQDAELQVVRRFHYHLAALHLDKAHAELGARASVEERRVA